MSKSAAGPLVAADAPLASDNDKPAAPNTGATLLLRLCFEVCLACDMIESNKKLTPRSVPQTPLAGGTTNTAQVASGLMSTA
jgi:hypothetical protein